MKYDISVKKIEDENSKIKAIATLTLGDAFTIKGIKLYEGEKGLFVSMPNYKKMSRILMAMSIRISVIRLQQILEKRLRVLLLINTMVSIKMNRRLQIAGLALLKKIRLLDLRLSR